MLFEQTKNLIYKDLRLELRQKYAINGILLYVVSTMFICYLSFNRILDTDTWNALFWIIMLFSAVNAVSKSFVQESPARHLYYYTLTSPQAVILSKILYNILIMLILSALGFVAFISLMGNLVVNLSLFILALLLGSIGFAGMLTMVAGIASRTNNNFTIMALLSFPIALPLLSTLMKISGKAMQSADWGGNTGYILVLLLIDIIVVALSYVLFPYLWKD